MRQDIREEQCRYKETGAVYIKLLKAFTKDTNMLVEKISLFEME